MKRNSRSQVERLLLKRLEEERHERNIKSKQKAQLLRTLKHPSAHKLVTTTPPPERGNRKARRKRYKEIRLPPNLDLITGYAETIEVIKDISYTSLVEKRPIFLNFDDVKTIKPAALLLLLAETNRCRLIHGSDKVTGNYPHEARIERMLDGTGFFKLLGVVSRLKKRPKRYPLEYVEFVSHTDEVKGTVRKFREALLGTTITLSPKAKSRLYRSLTEAMLNVRHHAYPTGSRKTHPERGRWWLAGHVNRKSRELMIMFCDLGVGIPATLPKIYPMEIIRAALAILPGVRPNDGQMIQAAMKLGRTRTAEENRGRGLNDLRSLVDQAGSGELHIFSSKGYYCYRPNGEEKVKNYSKGIGGTLIKWTVPLDAITDWTGNDLDYDETTENN